jgi:hypothetical protein
MTMRAGRSARQFRDPERNSLGKWCNPSPAELNRVGLWTEADREMMDAQFRLATTTALEAGLERCATEPSTHPGTKCPIAGYRRD